MATIWKTHHTIVGRTATGFLYTASGNVKMVQPLRKGARWHCVCVCRYLKKGPQIWILGDKKKFYLTSIWASSAQAAT